MVLKTDLLAETGNLILRTRRLHVEPIAQNFSGDPHKALTNLPNSRWNPTRGSRYPGINLSHTLE